MTSDYRLESLWNASTQRGQIFFVADFFGEPQFVALNPPVACGHSKPHEVVEAYTVDQASQASAIWGPEPAYLFSPSPGTIAPILDVSDNHFIVFNVDNCRPETSPMPVPGRNWLLYDIGSFKYWLPFGVQSIPLSAF